MGNSSSSNSTSATATTKSPTSTNNDKGTLTPKQKTKQQEEEEAQQEQQQEQQHQQQQQGDGPTADSPMSTMSPLPSSDDTTTTTKHSLLPPSLSLMAPVINISIHSGSPSPPGPRSTSPIYSGRAASPTPSLTNASPPPSPRSNVTRGSSVSSAGEGRSTSFFWNMHEQYQHRKMARRQSQLESAGHLGRPCCFVLQSITVQGNFPAHAQVQTEVSIVADTDQPTPNLVAQLPAVRTAPRAALRPGQINLHGQEDVLIFPSVTTSSALAITVFLDGVAIGSVRYPLSEVKATLLPTELRLAPGTGVHSPRSRSPTLRNLHMLSPVPPSGTRGVRSSSPPPPSSSSSVEATAAGGMEGPATLHLVWGELTFYDNRISSVGWVDVLEEGGKMMNQRRLLVVTPLSFTFLETPQCLLGHHPATSYSMTQVTHVEPGGRKSLLLPEKPDSPIPAGGGGVNGLVTISLNCPEKGVKDIVFAVDNEEDSRRWVQVLKRASYEAAFGVNA